MVFQIIQYAMDKSESGEEQVYTTHSAPLLSSQLKQ